MSKKNIYHYYVEGEDEKSVLNALKSELRCIESGKIDQFNVIQNRFTQARIRSLKDGTIVVLVYDTDVESNMENLQYNIEFLKRQRGIKAVLCIPQVKNLEDELTRACRVKCAEEITQSRTTKDYKKELITCTNLGNRLCKCGFDISKFWSIQPNNKFSKYGNDAEKIKIREK